MILQLSELVTPSALKQIFLLIYCNNYVYEPACYFALLHKSTHIFASLLFYGKVNNCKKEKLWRHNWQWYINFLRILWGKKLLRKSLANKKFLTSKMFIGSRISAENILKVNRFQSFVSCHAHWSLLYLFWNFPFRQQIEIDIFQSFFIPFYL